MSFITNQLPIVSRLKIQLLLLLIITFTINLQAQQLLSTSGGLIANQSGSISYTVGQTAHVSISGPTMNILGGVQQPFEISVFTSVEDVRSENLTLSVFPNPVQQRLILRADEALSANYQYKLYNIQGEQILSGSMNGAYAEINVDFLPSATYILQVSSGNAELKTFRIIKK